MTSLSRVRLTNLLLLLSALLSVVAVALSADVPDSSELQARRRHLLPHFRSREVRRLELRRDDVVTVVERRESPERSADDDASHWVLLEPLETDVDLAALERLLGALRYATWLREASDPSAASAAEGGDAEAKHRRQELSVHVGERHYRMQLGGKSVAPRGARYVEVSVGRSPARTFVIEEQLANELFFDGAELRGRQIVPYRKGSVERLVLSSAGGVRRLQRGEIGFRFDGMNDDRRVDRSALDRVFLSLARASAEPFVEPEVARALLGVAATVRVALTPRDRSRREALVELGGACPGADEKTLALRHLPEPAAGCVDRSVLFALREPAGSLEDAGVFSLRVSEVERLLVVEGDRRLDLARRGEGFVLTKPRAASVDVEAARDRLERILGLRGELLTGSARPRSPERFAHIVVRVESSSVSAADRASSPEPARLLGTASGEVLEQTVRVSKPRKSGAVWVYRESDGAVLSVSADDAVALWPDATLLKDPRVFDYELSQVRSVSIEGTGVAQTLTRSAEGGLALEVPAGFEVDGGLAVQLLEEVRRLRAVRWVTDRQSSGFGLSQPQATLRLSVVQGDREITRVLRLGRRAPGGHYASVDRDPGVFIIPRVAERAMTTWLLSRSVFAVSRDRLVELDLQVSRVGRVVVRRVAGELGVQSGSKNFDPARLDELLSAFEHLRPESALRLGSPERGEGFRKPSLTALVRTRSPRGMGITTRRIRVGSRDSVRGASVYYARTGSVNATFGLPSHQVRRLLDLF